RALRIIHLPGHTPGSIAVLDVKNRVLISGDPIQAHGHIFMFGSHRNMEEYIRSLERLEALQDQFDEIWPSHADIPIAPDTIHQLVEGARDVIAGIIKGTPAEMHGTPIVAYDVGISTLLCDR
ncbi:MAG: MBL fold metallo-hydrolase, partial [Clostridia bacterium]|nr:MBL fold metallo-hydrolase [Clostridia bacterium]